MCWGEKKRDINYVYDKFYWGNLYYPPHHTQHRHIHVVSRVVWRTPSEKMNWRRHQWMWNWGNSNILLNYSNESKFIFLPFEFIWTCLSPLCEDRQKKLKDRSFIFISKPSADVSNFGNGGSCQEGEKKLRGYWNWDVKWWI